MKKLGILALLASSSLVATAQEGLGGQKDDGYNKFSTKKIHESDIMWKKSVVRALDLREKQNKPLFADGQEFSKLIMDAVLEGVLTPYLNDSLSDGTKLTLEEFKTAYIIPGLTNDTGGDDDGGWGDDDGGDDWGDSGGDDWGDSGDDASEDVDADAPVDLSSAVFYTAKDLYQLEINEDILFDNQRSVLYYDVQSVTLYVPADHPDNIKGIQTPVATFSYKELVEKVFKDNPSAIWYNPYNDQEHRNLEHAFELRLFSSYLVKVSNPSGEFIVDTYGGDPKTGIMASQWKQFEMLEFEHNLWEF